MTVIGDLSLDRSYVRSIPKPNPGKWSEWKVTILGHVTDSELAIKLKENHVLAVLSYYEGFGIVYLEGMGFGLPAIGTSSGGANEIITHGRNGFLIPAGDSAALAQYLRILYEERERLATMSLKAYRHFISHPTWENTCENILNFLESW